MRGADRRQNRRTELRVRVRVCASQTRTPDSRVSKGPSSPLSARRPRLVSSRRSGSPPGAPCGSVWWVSPAGSLRASALPPTMCKALPGHGAPAACRALASSLRSRAAAIRLDTERPRPAPGVSPVPSHAAYLVRGRSRRKAARAGQEDVGLRLPPPHLGVVAQHHVVEEAEEVLVAGGLQLVRLFATPWIVTRQTPLSIECSKKEYWSGLPFCPPGDLLDPVIKVYLLCFLHWQAGSLPLSHLGSPSI